MTNSYDPLLSTLISDPLPLSATMSTCSKEGHHKFWTSPLICFSIWPLHLHYAIYGLSPQTIHAAPDRKCDANAVRHVSARAISPPDRILAGLYFLWHPDKTIRVMVDVMYMIRPRNQATRLESCYIEGGWLGVAKDRRQGWWAANVIIPAYML